MSQTITTADLDEVDAPTEPSVDGSEFVYLDPADIVIGTNVRTDLRPGEKEFRKSVKERGVLEPVTVYRDDAGTYVLLRGQRRTVTAAQVGTPTGQIPARVVAQPGEADRIGDQLVENIHRAGMHEREIVAGVEQLALVGVSAAQIAKRTAIARPTVDAAMAVTEREQARARVESGDLTLGQAAVFAEFEGDEEATARLERSLSWGRPLEHEAQRLRDEAVERAAYDAEVERLRGEGLPALTRDQIAEVKETGYLYRIERLVTADGEPLPEAEWPNVPSAALHVEEQWIYPDNDDHHSNDHSDDVDTGAAETIDDAPQGSYPEPYQAYMPVWVVTDLAASGLHTPSSLYANTNSAGTGSDTDDEAERERKRERKRDERRRVIANNKSWLSAETVRREWLARFVTRKSAPKGAEALICEAVLTGNHALSKAMDHRHPMLFKLLAVEHPSGYYGPASACQELATKPATPKAATMTALAAVLAAWEDTTGKHTWRNPDAWDARILGALMQWGYEPSDVELILIGDEPGTTTEQTTHSAASD